MASHSDTSIAVTRQKEIYLNGAAGIRPKIPMGFSQLEKEAEKVLSNQAFAYIAGGAGTESTLRENRHAFDRWKIVPRMLRDVSARSTKIDLFGESLPAPLLLSPVGVLEMAHKEADLAVARAAATTGIPMIFSNQASVAMEPCAVELGISPRWFQLYWSKSNELVASLVSRAEKSGCSAIVVTLDTTMLGWRMRDLDLAYLPFLRGKGIAQYVSDPIFQQLLDQPKEKDSPPKKITLSAVSTLIQMVKAYPGRFFPNLRSGRPLAAVQQFIDIYSRPSLTWKNLAFLREHTRLPIVLKGILHPDDAKKALDYGIDGIIVSNHGGRQVDGSISTIEALPPIVAAINNQIPILIDSGIRGGADMFKAIALGATAVCVGRPFVYALALAGQAGVVEFLMNMMADFELTMGLSGCRNIQEINSDTLAKVEGF